MARSMGNRVALEAIEGMKGEKPVRNYFSIAAAIDDEAIEPGGRYGASIEKCQKVWAFHSENDNVLKFIYRLAEFDAALGYQGAEDRHALSDHVHLFDATDVVNSHRDYRKSPEIFQVVHHILSGKNQGDLRKSQALSRNFEEQNLGVEFLHFFLNPIRGKVKPGSIDSFTV